MGSAAIRRENPRVRPWATDPPRVPWVPMPPANPPMPFEDAHWTALLHREMPPLYRAVSRSVGGDRELAEDAVQETWLRAIQSWSERGVPEDAGAWLRTVARNLLRNHFRDQGTRAAARADLARDGHDTLTDDRTRDDADRAAHLQAQLARLPPDQSELLQERYLEEVGTEELCRRHGTTARGIEGRLRRARAALARQMNGHPTTPPTSHRSDD